MALFSVFVDLFDVWLHKGRVSSHVCSCPPPVAVGINQETQPCGILPTTGLISAQVNMVREASDTLVLLGKQFSPSVLLERVFGTHSSSPTGACGPHFEAAVLVDPAVST